MLLPSGPRGAPRPLYWFSVGLCGERGRVTKSSLGRAGDGGMFCYLLSRTGFCFTGRGHHRPWAGEAVSRAGSATVSLGALDQSQACLGLSFSVHRRGDAGDQQARVDGSCPAQGPRGPRPDGGVLAAEGGPGHSRAGRATRGAGWRQRPEGEWLCVQAAPPAHQVRAAQQRARNKTCRDCPAGYCASCLG